MEQYAARSDGHNLQGRPALSAAGVVYSIFIIAYTAVLLVGIALLGVYRGRPAIRIRGLVITLSAIVSIHIYLAAIFIVYPLNGWYKCDTEFWYMSVIFPLGIALFQASNVRLMSYAKMQQGLIDLKCWGERRQSFSFKPRGFLKWLKAMNYVKKTYFFICMGLIVQFLLTVFLYFGSRRFNGTTGIWGEPTDPMSCRRGPEWVPSVFWQFIWSWVIGPYVLFKTRHIKDTHYWAWQTRAAVFAGLPGTPLWLAFIYSDSRVLANLDSWWIPAMWFAPGLITMQVTSIVCPLYDVYRHPGNPRRPASVASSSSTAPSIRSTIDPRRSKELARNYEAFKFQLKHNIDPLFRFAATRDFTAENIRFLQEVRDFKYKWQRRIASPVAIGVMLTHSDQREMYLDAARIYFELVCPGTSIAYINVDSKTYFDLENTFKGLKYEPPVQVRRQSSKSDNDNAVAPWDSPTLLAAQRSRSVSPADTESETALIDVCLDTRSNIGLLMLPPSHATLEGANSAAANVTSFATPHMATITPIANHGSAIPPTFSIKVFDEAEKSVMYLVYTNTWKNFVANADAESICSFDSGSGNNTLVPSRTGSTRRHGRAREHHGIGEAEMQDMSDHEFRDDADSEVHAREFHHGVLDIDEGPKPIEKVDSRCRHCRENPKQGEKEKEKEKEKKGAQASVEEVQL